MADGQVIVGYGVDPNGRTQGWIASLGPPGVPFLAFNAKLVIQFGSLPDRDQLIIGQHVGPALGL